MRAERLLAAATAAALLLGGPAAPSLAGAPAERQLFENGDFEDGVGPWTTLDQSGTSTFEVDPEVKQSGKQSLRIRRTGQGIKDFLKQSADLPPGVTSVRATVWFRVEKGARVQVDVYFFDAAGETVGKGYMTLVTSGATKKFEKSEDRFDVPKGATGVGMNAIVAAPGTVWLDAVEVACKATAAATGTPVIGNGGFETSLQGWTPLAFGTGTSEAKLDRAVKSVGKASVRIDRASPRLLPEDGLATEVVGGGDLGTLRLRFDARVAGDARATVVLQALDEKGRVLATVREPVPSAPEHAEGRLTALSARIDAPAGSRRLAVSLVVVGRGTAWFDNLVLDDD